MQLFLEASSVPSSSNLWEEHDQVPMLDVWYQWYQLKHPTLSHKVWLASVAQAWSWFHEPGFFNDGSSQQGSPRFACRQEGWSFCTPGLVKVCKCCLRVCRWCYRVNMAFFKDLKWLAWYGMIIDTAWHVIFTYIYHMLQSIIILELWRVVEELFKFYGKDTPPFNDSFVSFFGCQGLGCLLALSKIETLCRLYIIYNWS